MNHLLNKLERKLGRHAIPNLILWLLAGYAIGFTLAYTAPEVLSLMTLEPYYILRGQVWRLITWVLMPPDTSLLFAVIMMLFYYQLGQSLERTWGSFRFNVYIFGGILFTVIGAFVLYGIFYALNGIPVTGMGAFFTTNYINMSIFLAFAVCYPNMQVYLYFIVPVKMKWLAVVYGGLIVFSLIQTNWAGAVAIISSLLNFLVFYVSTRDFHRISPKEIHRRQAFKSQMRQSAPRPGITKHKCAICGRTEKDDPALEFRFCSKCEGNYEYCQDHLFSHQHVRKS
ncbi:hypothetical protein IMSAGC012_02111 [Lachnospiraceae bacterium]|nr:hypothetical protein [Eubacterium sp.]GFI26987.1 hypothetical protein IMSAGC012_02111 [Lachnospiraceae bacterium]